MVSSPVYIGDTMRHDGNTINHQRSKEENMDKLTSVGPDLAKNVFHLFGF